MKQSKSLYQELIFKIIFFLILPFLVVAGMFYAKLVVDSENSIAASRRLVTADALSIRQQQVDTMHYMAQRIASNNSLKGFFLVNYTNTNLNYYKNQITQLVSLGLLDSSDYQIKLYLQNQTIPRGFDRFYHLSDIDADGVTAFLQSDEIERWVTPAEAHLYPANTMTPFQGHYTYLRKVFVNQRLLYLMSISTSEKNMDAFLSGNSEHMFRNPAISVSPSVLLLNYTGETVPALDTPEDARLWLESNPYPFEIMKLSGFPQALIYVWEKPNRMGLVGLGLLLFVLFSLSYIAMTIYSVRKVFTGIYGCLRDFDTSRSTGFSTKLPVTGSNETSRLAEAFNVQIDKIQELLRFSEQQAGLAKESQLLALQRQINPHFLYNTLEVFAYKMELYRHYKEADAMSAFSRMLRYNTSLQNRFATIRNELEQVENYLSIQQLKHPQVRFAANVPENLLDTVVPRFLLQPLVENSFSHGWCGKPLKLSLSCVDLKEDLLFEICDNGCGISEKRLAEINTALRFGEENATMGIGLQNINKRLQLFYGEGYHVSLASEEGKFTMVTFHTRKQLGTDNPLSVHLPDDAAAAETQKSVDTV